MSNVNKSLRSLTKNERPWAIRSGCSPKMSKSLVFLSQSLIRPFFRKKRAIRLENSWANSQPCKKYIHDLLIKPNLSLVDQMPRFLCKDGDSVPVYSIHWYKFSFENFIFKTNFYPMISLQIRRASGKKICFIRACSTPDKKSLLALVPPSTHDLYKTFVSGLT